VELAYRPRSVIWGAVITMLALMAALALVLRSAAARRNA